MRLILLTCLIVSLTGGTRAFAAVENTDSGIQRLTALTDAHAFVKANNLLDHMMAVDPNNPKLRVAGARLYRQMGLFAKSMSDYKQIMQAYPNMIEPVVALAQMYMEYLNPRQAQNLAQHALSMDPKNRDARIVLCASLISSGYLKEADDEISKLLRENTGDPEVNYVAYKLYLERGQLDRARRQLETVMKVNPNNGQWLVDMSELCKVQGDYAEANRCLQRALDTDPTSVDKLSKMAILQEYFFRDYDQAMKEYRKILHEDPDSVTALAGLDRCRAKKNDLAGMLKYQLRSLFTPKQ